MKVTSAYLQDIEDAYKKAFLPEMRWARGRRGAGRSGPPSVRRQALSAVWWVWGGWLVG